MDRGDGFLEGKPQVNWSDLFRWTEKKPVLMNLQQFKLSLNSHLDEEVTKKLAFGFLD